MKTIILPSAAIKNMFHQLQENLGGTFNVNVKEHMLTVDNEFGVGSIRGINFKGGISYLEFDIMFTEDCTLKMGTPENTPICFAYCSCGKIAHSFGSESEKHFIENFQTGLLTNAPYEENILHFAKDVRVRTSLIIVKPLSDTTIPKTKSLNYRIHELIMKGGSARNSFYLGSYNLKIADKIQQLDAIVQQGLVRSLLIEGLVHMILALEIQQHTEDSKNMKNNYGSLTGQEMDAVNEVSKYINNHAEHALSIADLSKKSGLSPMKLQEGFKLMHGSTVNQYIREVRIARAVELIKNSDFNISEVVYSIGFTSRSYFSKIFREKYNLSPKEYRDNNRIIAVSA